MVKEDKANPAVHCQALFQPHIAIPSRGSAYFSGDKAISYAGMECSIRAALLGRNPNNRQPLNIPELLQVGF